MKIIKRLADDVVVYAGDDLELTETHAGLPGEWIDRSSTTETHEILEVTSLPDLWTGGAYKHTDAGFELANETLLEMVGVSRARMAQEIDDAVQAVYDKPMRLSKEYETRETEATAYKAAGYTGAAPRVKAFADAEGLSLKDAVDVTLQQAAMLRGALDTLSDLRMLKRYVTRADVPYLTARAKHQQAMSTIAAIAANLT